MLSVRGLSPVFEIWTKDKNGNSHVTEAFDSVHDAKVLLEAALNGTRNPEDAARIMEALGQVYEELAYLHSA
jgi:hypothetical protein